MHFPYFMGEFHQSVRDGDRCIQFASPFKPRTDTSHSQYLPCALCLLLSASRLLLSAFYCLLATNFTRSRTRQEYPHSLSYHEVTFTQFPSITFVKPASTIEERGSPRKSAETNSSSVYPRMPLSGPFQRVLHLLRGGAFFHKSHQVHQRDVGRGDTHGIAIEFALEFRQHQPHGLGRTGCCGDDGKCCGAGATQVLVRQVERPLVVGVRVNRGHR